jgi:hypothetical protein
MSGKGRDDVGECEDEEGRTQTRKACDDMDLVDSPPPYANIRPVRANSCLSSPFFSTTCCAVMSPTANSTAVVMLCVSSGRAASLRWYLAGRDLISECTLVLVAPRILPEIERFS